MIGVILGALGIIGILTTLTVGTAVLTAMAGVAGAAVSGVVWVSALISIAVLVVTLILEAMAIQPLKAVQKRGWNLIFLSTLVGAAGSAVREIVSGQVIHLLWTIIWAAIGLYLLFELRGHYLAKRAK